ncbi:MAG: SGNH/GDSL hydrolase family protein [Prolixibacteraceae bacterium]
MKNLLFIFTLLFTILATSSCTKADEFVTSNSNQIHYMGRIVHTDTMASFYWSGTSAQINFEGTAVKAMMQDETGDNYYNVIIDNDSVIVIRPTNKKELITLAENLTLGKHSLELFKRTEYDRGRTDFYGFELNMNASLLAPKPVSEKKIEFYGNSITCGYAVDDTSGRDRSDSIFTNNYKSYAALTARHYNAEYMCTSKSGIGITVSWFPYIMPDIYDHLIPLDPNSKWDFSQYTPDVVVILLMQNDSWLVNMPQHDSFKKYFGTEKPSEEFIIHAYKTFVSNLRSKYPTAQIICSMGGMDATREGSPWPGYVVEAVRQMDDKKVFTYFMPYHNINGHPNQDEQAVMAKGLIKFIDENINW